MTSHVPIAFIVGVGRSGTSILGEWIGAHESVSYVFEDCLFRQFPCCDLPIDVPTSVDLATPEVIAALHEWAERSLGARELLVEKNPRHVFQIPFLRAVFPQVKFIHIVRDGRDVACSLQSIWNSNAEAAAEWGAGDPRFAWSDIRRCASVWMRSMEALIDGLAGTTMLQFNYYDMLDPETRDYIERLLCTFLMLSPSDGMHEFGSKISADRSGYQAREQDRYTWRLEGSRHGAWRHLPPLAQREVTDYLGPMLRRFGFLE